MQWRLHGITGRTLCDYKVEKSAANVSIISNDLRYFRKDLGYKWMEFLTIFICIITFDGE